MASGTARRSRTSSASCSLRHFVCGRAQPDGQEREGHELGRVGLGGGHADLRAGLRVEHPSLSRARLLPGVLQMESTRQPARRAMRTEASVSAVSPDWETETTSVAGIELGVAVAEFAAQFHFHRRPVSASMISRPYSPA